MEQDFQKGGRGIQGLPGGKADQRSGDLNLLIQTSRFYPSDRLQSKNCGLLYGGYNRRPEFVELPLARNDEMHGRAAQASERLC